MVDFTTVSLGILLVTSIFNSIDAVLKRVKKSKCRGVEVEFGKEAAPPAQTVTNTNIITCLLKSPPAQRKKLLIGIQVLKVLKNLESKQNIS